MFVLVLVVCCTISGVVAQLLAVVIVLVLVLVLVVLLLNFGSL